MGRGLGAGLDLVEVGLEVGPAALGLDDHRLKALDLQGASRAVAACEVAGAMANEAFSRAVALHDAETQARIFALVMRALRDLAAMVDEPEDAEVKPRRRRGYVWEPGLVSPVR